MKQNETINGIKVINTLNSDINRRSDSPEIKTQNIFKRDKIRLKRNSLQNIVSKKNIKKINSKKNLMTKEQRTILNLKLEKGHLEKYF